MYIFTYVYICITPQSLFYNRRLTGKEERGCLSEQVLTHILAREPRRCNTEDERERERERGTNIHATSIWLESLARDRHAVECSYGIYTWPDLAGHDRILCVVHPSRGPMEMMALNTKF